MQEILYLYRVFFLVVQTLLELRSQISTFWKNQYNQLDRAKYTSKKCKDKSTTLYSITILYNRSKWNKASSWRYKNSWNSQHVHFGLITIRKNEHNKHPSARSLLVTRSLWDDYSFIPRFPSIYQKMFSRGQTRKMINFSFKQFWNIYTVFLLLEDWVFKYLRNEVYCIAAPIMASDKLEIFYPTPRSVLIKLKTIISSLKKNTGAGL